MARLARSAATVLAVGMVLAALSAQAAAQAAPEDATTSTLTAQPSSKDVLVSGEGDEHGYHLYKATAANG